MLTQSFDFNSPITANTTLYAKYTFALSYTKDAQSITITGLIESAKAITTNLSIPATIEGLPVLSIATNAFRDYTSLTSIALPNGITSIGANVFYGCTGLTSISIPNSVTSIGSGTFQVCTSLTSIAIPNNLTVINMSIFYGCTGLTSISIPASVTSIGGFAFRGCTKLTSITMISATPPSLGNYAIPDDNDALRIHVPSSDAVIAYQNAAGWSTFSAKIVTP